MCFALYNKVWWAAGIFGIALLFVLFLGPRITRKRMQNGTYVCTRCLVRYSYYDLEGGGNAT
jgi:hypothetical protein